MLELFGVLFITLFIAFLLTLVILNLDTMFKKGNVEKVSRSSFGLTKERAERISLNTQNAYCKKYVNVSNEIQEKYLETLPKHKTRIKLRASRKLRNKRKGKK